MRAKPVMGYRSTLEYRWSLFFETLRLEYEYEPIRLPGYIPDFRVKTLGLVEIKPENFKFDDPRHEGILVFAGLPHDNRGFKDGVKWDGWERHYGPLVLGLAYKVSSGPLKLLRKSTKEELKWID